MVIVIGRELSVLVGLADRLHSRGLEARVLADGENLFDSVAQLRPEAIVVVDALGGAPGDTDASLVGWDDLLRVARGPTRPRLVWCTSRPEVGPGARLRRSGIAYVTVRAGVLVTPLDLGFSELRGRTVHIASDLTVPEAGLTPLTALLDVLVEASTTAQLGHTFDVRYQGADAWSKVIERLGGRPKMSARALVRMMSWLGARALLRAEPGSPPARRSTTPEPSFDGGAIPPPSQAQARDGGASAV